MEIFVAFAKFCVILAGFCRVVRSSIATIYPPHLNVSDDVILKEEDTLYLSCSGRHPLKWNISHEGDDLLERTNVREDVQLYDGIPQYTSTLEVVQMSYVDSGYVSCYYDGTHDLEDPENITMAYVYVYDGKHLFVPDAQFGDSLIIHPIYQHQQSVIPCRTTHPNVSVSLTKAHEKEVTKGDDIVFDAREGFVVEYSSTYFSGPFECIARFHNITQNLSLHLMWLPDTSGPPVPHIDESGTHVVLNGTLALTCAVNIETGTMLVMNWTFPNKGIDMSGRIVEGSTGAVDKTSSFGQLFRQVTRTLTVNGAIMSDQGAYRCTVTDHTGKRNHKEKVIKIFDNVCHINLTTDMTDVINVTSTRQKEVRFIVRLEAHPSPTIVWTKGLEELKAPTAEKYSINTTKSNTTLIIKNPTRFDSGFYQMVASVCDKMREINVTLNVLEPPTVTLIKVDNRTFLANSKTVLSCHVQGSPRPEVTWEWRPCWIPGCNTKYQKLELRGKNREENQIDILDPNDPGSVKSSLGLTAQYPGFYRCSGTNKFGTVSQDTQFIVSNFSNGFDIQTSTKQVVETEEFIMKCGATVFKYSKLEWYWKPNKIGYGYNLLGNQTGITVIETEYRSNLVLVLRFHNVSLSNSGIYRCSATERISSRFINKEKPVVVKEIVKPTFTGKTNMNGSVISIPVDKEFSFICTATGTPNPYISWYKNGQALNVSHMPWVDLVADGTRLNIKRVRHVDSGIYSCAAYNKGGYVTTNLTLEVLGELSNTVMSSLKLNEWTTGIVAGIVIAVIVVIILLSILTRKFVEERRHQREMELLGQLLFEQGDMNSYNPEIALDEQIDLLPYDKRWEFPKERLKLGKTLGQGAFGRVVKAEAIGLQEGEASTTVAVKMLKERANLMQKKALMQELKVMIHLGRHLNVVNLLGAVTKNLNKGELYVIVEYCRYGNLRHLFLSHRDNFIDQIDPLTGKINPQITRVNQMRNPNAHLASKLNHSYQNCPNTGTDTDVTVNTDTTSVFSSSNTSGMLSSNQCPISGDSDYLTCYKKEVHREMTTCDLLCYAFQVARGMEYLAGEKLVHRDLAARNILLAENNVVKICDFGLAKDLYKYSNYKKKGNGPLPVKWMALESIRDRVFSSQSDVWSFGIVLWEFFTMGGNPYPGIEIDEEFYRKLKSGYRMEKPEFSTDEMYEMMLDCWKAEPKERPTFSELAEQLGNSLEASIKKYYIDLTITPPYVTMKDGDGKYNNNEYLTMINNEVTNPNYVNTGNDVNYVNLTVPAPLSVPRGDSVSSDYLSMQSPTSKFPPEDVFPFSPTGPSARMPGNKFRFGSDSSANSGDLELQPLSPTSQPLLEMNSDPWVKRQVEPPMTEQTETPAYLFMGRGSVSSPGVQHAKKSSTDSGDSMSSGFQSDFNGDSSAPPSYSLVTGIGDCHEFTEV